MMGRFAIASLTPAAFLALGCLVPGVWPLLGLVSVSLLVAVLDLARLPQMTSRSSGLALCVVLACVHFALLGLGIRAIGAGAHLDPANTALLLLGLGLYLGQVSLPVAHEMIHRPGRIARRLGASMFLSLFYGHHVPAHLRVHHVHVATDADPNSARLGESFYSFARRAIAGELLAGLAAELRARGQARSRPALWSHPGLVQAAGALAGLSLALLLGGGLGVLALLLLAAHAQMQLLLSDYVQHYGLRRTRGPDGRMEPVGPRHSWNARPWYSASMMLNAPRHSDHHIHPSRPFPSLELERESMPMLPFSLPVMATLALVPPLWHRLMDPRVARWTDDRAHVTSTASASTGPSHTTLAI